MSDADVVNELGHTAKANVERARRSLCRQIGSALIHGMSVTDTDMMLMAIRIGTSENQIRDLFNRLIDGKSISLNWVSDLFFSMGLEIQINLVQGRVAVSTKELPFSPPQNSQIEEASLEADDETAEKKMPA